MTITAKIIADSVGPKTERITTFELRYPRFIHAELMTHRMFSRNASSSRAIPVERQIESIREDTAMPVHWGANQKGMQADNETDALVSIPTDTGGCVDVTAQEAWFAARDRAIAIAEGFVAAKYHKQVVNRILEPFSHITVIVTATNYANFFSLRCHKDAQPEIKVLADIMYDEYIHSTPKFLEAGEWHLPYITDREVAYVHSEENTKYADIPATMDDLLKASVSRCARVSYKTHDGKEPSLSADLALYERLVGSVPLHASPAEHQATPDEMVFGESGVAIWSNPSLSGNFDKGWIQYRKTLPHEAVSFYSPQ